MGEMQDSEKYIVKYVVYDMLDHVVDMSLMSNVVYVDASKIELNAFLISYNISCCKNQKRKNDEKNRRTLLFAKFFISISFN